MGEQNGGLYQPEFPDHWERRSLYNLARWVNGLAFREINFSPTGWPVIKIAEVKNGISGQTKFTEQSFDDSVRVRSGDLIFSWSGQPETSIDAFWWRGTEGWLNQHLFRVTPREDVDRTFFYYLLRYLNPNFVGIARNKQTTGLGHVTRRDLEAIEAGLPPLSEQRAIAEVLGALDDKIEANRRVTAIADSDWQALLAQRGEEGDLVPLASLGRFVNGRAFTNGASGTGRMVIRIAELNSGPGGSTVYNDIEVADDNLARPGDLLFAWSGSLTLQRWFRSEAIVNQHIFKVLPSGSTPLWFIHGRLLELLPFFKAVAAGKATTMGHIQRHHLDEPVLLPAAEQLADLDRMCLPLWQTALAAERENLVLSAFRDALLPKLLSGEMRVRDAEELAGEAV